jgi:endonuclease-3
VIVEDLYKKYPDVNALAEATPEEIERLQKCCSVSR